MNTYTNQATCNCCRRVLNSNVQGGQIPLNARKAQRFNKFLLGEAAASVVVSNLKQLLQTTVNHTCKDRKDKRNKQPYLSNLSTNLIYSNRSNLSINHSIYLSICSSAKQEVCRRAAQHVFSCSDQKLT